MIVAIDGPAGAGKSTVSKELAKNLSFLHLDSGAFYRCYALFTLEKGIPPEKILESVPQIISRRVHADYSQVPPRFFLDSCDVTKEIRTNPVSARVSTVSAVEQIRDAVLQKLRETGKQGNFIVDGRDIGTVVFPQAELKFFLTASIEERARRRHNELLRKGEVVDFEELKDEIRIRDERDSTRKIAPLKQAEDAILVDSSRMNRAEVVAYMTEMVMKYKRENSHKTLQP